MYFIKHVLLKIIFSSIPKHIRDDWIETVDKELSELKEENFNKEKYVKGTRILIQKYTELHRQHGEPKNEIRLTNFNKTERKITVLHV